MKRIGWIILILMALSLAAQDEEEEEYYYRFQATLGANALMSVDKGFADTYGRTSLYPEFTFSYKFKPNFYAYVGYGMLSAKGLTADLKLEAKTSQNFISLGAGYNRPLGERFELFGSLGMVMVMFKETAFDETISGSKLGFRADAAIAYVFSERLLANLSIGFIQASRKIEVEEGMESETASIGGFKAGLGVCYRF